MNWQFVKTFRRLWNADRATPPRSRPFRRSTLRVELLEDRLVLSTGLQLRLEQPGIADVLISDNGPGDSNATVGVIAYIGAVGTFDINTTAGISKPLLGSPNSQEMDISSFNLSSTAGGTLIITLVDTDFTLPVVGANPLTLTSQIGGTLTAGAGSSVSFQTWANADNLSAFLPGPQTQIPTGCVSPGHQYFENQSAYSGSYSTSFVRDSGPFSMIEQVTINLNGPGSAGLDAFLSVAGQAPPQLAKLGDYVWEDLNGNGKQDVNEPGIDGVTVNLTGAGVDAAFGTEDDTTATTTTSGGGLYLFSDLTPGDYMVEFVKPSGYVFTSVDMGSNDAIDSDANVITGKTGTISLAAGDENLTIDAGLLRPAKLGDFVWKDCNGNGKQDSGEPGIPCVTVKLTGAGADGTFGTADDYLATTVTDGHGRYMFNDLLPGDYIVEFIRPSGYIFTSPDVGSNDAIDSDADVTTGKTATINLVSGEMDLTIDAGLVCPAKLGNFVWKDQNQNGKQDSGEQGVNGVQVTLTGAGVDGVFGTADDFTATTTTSNGGGYLFSNLRPGNYKVTFTAPTGMVFTSANVGTNDAIDSDANPATGMTGTITLVAGEMDLTIDAGLVNVVCAPANSSLSGSVYVDRDNDARRDYGERGIACVVIKLIGIDVCGNQVCLTTVTDCYGTYRFNNLRAGTYTIIECDPWGYADGRDTAGSAGGTALNDRIVDIVLAQNVHGTGYNFGERTYC